MQAGRDLRRSGKSKGGGEAALMEHHLCSLDMDLLAQKLTDDTWVIGEINKVFLSGIGFWGGSFS